MLKDSSEIKFVDAAFFFSAAPWITAASWWRQSVRNRCSLKWLNALPRKVLSRRMKNKRRKKWSRENVLMWKERKAVYVPVQKKMKTENAEVSKAALKVSPRFTCTERSQHSEQDKAVIHIAVCTFTSTSSTTRVTDIARQRLPAAQWRPEQSTANVGCAQLWQQFEVMW